MGQAFEARTFTHLKVDRLVRCPYRAASPMQHRFFEEDAGVVARQASGHVSLDGKSGWMDVRLNLSPGAPVWGTWVVL